MTQYVGCDDARPLLEGLIDGELSMADQLAVESHLRWCDTCTLRVSDLRLIGASIRSQAAGRPDEAEDDTLNVLTDGLIVRVRAEQAQSLPSRIREMFADNHLLWPALGAVSAVLLCVTAASSVLHASTVQARQSLAGLISVIGEPGTEKWPLRPADNGITIPRLSDQLVDFPDAACRSLRCQDAALLVSDTLEQMPEEDVIYTVRTVVGRDGMVANYELLLSDESSPQDRAGAKRVAAQEVALINAIRNTRFVPAQTPLGQAVAVDVVLVIAKTTAVVAPDPIRRSAVERPREAPKPQREPVGPPVSEQPATARRSSPA